MMMSPAEAPLDLDVVVGAVLDTLPAREEPYPLHEPELGAPEREDLIACLESGWVSSCGAYVERFERDLARVAGTQHAIATNTGTAALHAALVLAGVQARDEVLVPALSFVATANAVSYCGGIPHFVECAEDTLGVSPHRLATHLDNTAKATRGGCVNRETGRPIRALVPVYVHGHPPDLERLFEIADGWGLELVQDATEALGSLYRDRPVCHGARLAALSFNGNKIVTTGGGGAIVTDDSGLAEAAHHLVGTAKISHRWETSHDRVGFNYRMPSLNAALGCAQLGRIAELLELKRELAARYAKKFAELDGVSFFCEPAGARSNYWLNALLLDPGHAHQRDPLLERLHSAGVVARPTWDPLHTLPMYRDCPRMALTTTEDLARRMICLPSSASLAGVHD
jgi:perosamine synthetase